MAKGAWNTIIMLISYFYESYFKSNKVASIIFFRGIFRTSKITLEVDG